MTKKTQLLAVLIIVITALLFFGCADNSASESAGLEVGTGGIGGTTGGPGADATAPDEVLGDGKVNLSMAFTDAPIDDADSVMVTINKIDIKKGACGTETENCDATGDACEFVTYFEADSTSDEQAIDLLQFRNGATFLFETVPLDEGEYCQFRFYLSEESDKNTITLTGDTEPTLLEINAGIRNNGLKLVSGLVLVDGEEMNLTVDFDVRKSIVVKGGKNNPRYALKPTIRIIQTDQSGNLTINSNIVTAEGQVFYLYEANFDVSNEADTMVWDDMGTDATDDDEEVASPFANAVSSAAADETLTAVFVAIPFGTYDLYSETEDASGDATLNLLHEDLVFSAQ